MKYLKKFWNHFLTEPFKLLFYCYFQPLRFKRDFEQKLLVKRIVPMLQAPLPMFLISWPVAIVIRILLYINLPTRNVFAIESGVAFFLGATALATLIGIVWSIVWGIGLGITWGLMGGFILGVIWGVTGSLAWSIAQHILGGLVGGVASGIAGGLAGRQARYIARALWKSTSSFWRFLTGGLGGGLLGGTAGGVVGGIAGGVIGNIEGSIILGVVVGISDGIVVGMTQEVSRRIGEDIGLGIVMGMVGGFALGIRGSILGGIGGGMVLVFLACLLGGIIGGVALGMIEHLFITVAGSVGLGFALSIALNASGSTSPLILGGIVLVGLCSYIIGYFRLPLYPISGTSALKAYFDSQREPDQVFTNLHRSSLYWDERVYLPLPYLKHTLLIAAEQSLDKTLEEVSFIVAERPQQLSAARVASLEIVLRDLETRHTLRDIARFSQRFTEIIPQEARLIDPRWVAPFDRLRDVSRDAARYCSPLGRQAKYTALEDMISNLRKVYPKVAFKEIEYNERLDKVVEKWLDEARHELERLKDTPQEIGKIENPYAPGPVLELRDSLFVGRRNLVQLLEESLSKNRRRPTFLLNGERRMGKTSALKQLPDLLGARYLPVFYDLQSRGISSSIVNFLGAIATEIYQAMFSRGMQVKRLEYERLIEASTTNEAEVYYVFEKWLADVESTLARESRMLLLTFDEFEKLMEVQEANYFDLRLLLDWFRSVIQNHPSLALLFSGVQTLSEMSMKTGINWAGYFVNVQTLKVGFLQPQEAHQLITQPVSDFPAKQIFGDGVVEELMRVTGCHPFLVQAVCSRLIDNLNTANCERAEIWHVSEAVDMVLESWWDTYFQDLWQRTTPNQQKCLFSIIGSDLRDLREVSKLSGMDEKTTHQTLQTLQRRDLILQEKGSYRIAAPIFTEWLERNR